MKLSQNTLDVLKNYTMINPSVLIQEGEVLRTIDPGETVIASAGIDQKFPKEFAIYDLPNFLQVVQMFDGAEIDFGDEDSGFCMITYEEDPDTKVRYFYASADAVDSIQKDVNTPPTEINFKLSAENLVSISKAATTMVLNHVVITPSGDDAVMITVTDVDNPSSNTFKIKVKAELEMDDFYVVIDFSKFVLLMHKDYDIGISSKQISHFFNEGIQYWVALNSNSTFG